MTKSKEDKSISSKDYSRKMDTFITSKLTTDTPHPETTQVEWLQQILATTSMDNLQLQQLQQLSIQQLPPQHQFPTTIAHIQLTVPAKNGLLIYQLNHSCQHNNHF